MSKCKWPGCKVEVKEGSFCGLHQRAMKIAYTFVYGICQDLHLTKEDAITWTHRFAPYILRETGDKATPFVVVTSVENKFAVKVFMKFGRKQRAAYDRARNLRCEGMVPTSELIRSVALEGNWLSVKDTARRTSVSHRYLRHLLYEDGTPALMALAVRNPVASRCQLGFVETSLEDVRTVLGRVDKSRKRN